MPLSRETVSQLLQESAPEIPLSLSAHQIDQFFFYLQELQKWNRAINLTGNADARFIIQHHFIDSLSCTIAPVITPHIRLLDIGAGAGFPGIPLKIYSPGIRLIAVDAVAKKVRFLQHLCRGLALQKVDCVAARLEPHVSSHTPLREAHHAALQPRAFDVVTSRAVGSIPELLQVAHPYLAPQGCLLLQRGRQGPHELREHRSWFQQYGFEDVHLLNVQFSFLEYPRYLMVACLQGREEVFNEK
ncbi:16S rRNA (guanine(527)-N(7))-methyltransferase RsmG [candidate division KSB3 bacterium]|uniref:Ribosomal RNA small subunit methyltransferase G n=1 Tax=candidate division KSB3 bacterium TaxID=2044937 RepID=A0A9D5Q4C6_9BACT|nr:16S rRNA (guanine(527)-N(7))-methyltransferase RsmG [candidate division KSB3 bacterium]MBD3323052.1 16S rRNA (guanine(527)-N(7))-methyltransferase RsmG [candidate division KSB3 bacterium]